MGMFDEVRCLYPLPWPAEELAGLEWQSKCTPAQYIDDYEIRADGTFWHEAYTVRFEEDPKAPVGFRIYRDIPHWEQVPWEGELEMHAGRELPGEPGRVHYSVRFWFRDGLVRDMIAHKDE